jgi:hypothetical protein
VTVTVSARCPARLRNARKPFPDAARPDRGHPVPPIPARIQAFAALTKEASHA